MEVSEVPVKVFVRVRPLTRSETGQLCVRFTRHDQLVLGDDRVFRFDRIFPPDTSQSEVFHDAVLPLVQKYLEGINCTIFAYGQTGSGKTYTLGSGGITSYCEGDQEGVIPRALTTIFEGAVTKQTEDQVNCWFSVSYIEVYREEVRDLLRDVSLGCVNGEVHIREDEQSNTVVIGVVEEEVLSVEEALGWLECGNSTRVTSATEMNKRSSRSHAIFTVTLVQQKGEQVDEGHVDDHEDIITSRLVSKFHFVDLAGSERFARTRNKGERFKESIFINSGLLALGNVISALSDSRRKSSHIPYRDSKITRLLKDSLGGSAHTVMLTCLSPAYEDMAESLNTLKYAKRARNIKNHPVVNRDHHSSRLLSMKEEIQSLRAELHRTKDPSFNPPHSATTVITVDSSAMVEMDDIDSHVANLKEELKDIQTKQQILLTTVNTVYQQLTAVIRSWSQSNVEEDGNESFEILERVQEVLLGIISDANIGNIVEQGSELVSRGTNTSLTQSSVEQEEKTQDRERLQKSFETIELLKRELEICQTDLCSDERLFAEKVAEYNTLHTQYLSVMERSSELEKIVDELHETKLSLEREVDILSQKLSLSQQQHQEYKNAQYTQSSVFNSDTSETSNHSSFTLSTDVIYSILHGKITNIQDLNEGTCDVALQQLTTLLTSQYEQLSHDDQESQDDNGSDGCHSNGTVPSSTQLMNREIEELSESMMISQEQLHTTEKRLLQAQHQMKSLNLKIRFKEELIHELVKNNKTFQCLNVAYQKKIDALERDTNILKLQLSKTESSQQSICSSDSDTVKSVTNTKKKDKETETNACKTGTHDTLSVSRLKRRKAKTTEATKTTEEQRKKLKNAESKLALLQRKRQETLRLLQMGEKSEKRIADLEGGIERLRNHQSSLKRRLKNEATRKLKLEEEVEKCRQKIQGLSVSNEQQSRVIRVKTEEAAIAQRKLRKLSGRHPTNMEVKQTWLDHEVEKLLNEKKALEAFEKELFEREAVISQHEVLLKEKREFEKKSIHSNHKDSQKMMRLSLQIESLDSSIREKEHLRESISDNSVSNLHKEIIGLKQERQILLDKRDHVCNGDGSQKLPDDQQRRVMELNEQIEVMETVIQLKNSSLNKSQHLTSGLSRPDTLSVIRAKILHLSNKETKSLLLDYINKVIDLRQALEESRIVQLTLEERLKKEEEDVENLEQSLDQSQIDKELRLTRLHKEHAQEVQVLLDHMTLDHNEKDQDICTMRSRMKELERSHTRKDYEIDTLRSKVKELEKDLYYYKKTSRELKQQMKESGLFERKHKHSNGSDTKISGVVQDSLEVNFDQT